MREASREGDVMKLVVRALSALALLAVASPALPCGDKAETHASTAKPSASSTTTDKQAVAKSDAKKADAKKADTKAKATATN
jgi:hypothetical protein